MAYLWTLLGLVALVAGAELLVRGAVGLALRTGLSTTVIGLTVVSLGTGAPEFAVALRSGTGGDAALALGNAVGSNIANVLLVLGLAAVVATAGLAVTERVVRTDVPLMAGVSVLVLVLALDRTIGRWEGLALLAGLVAYVAWTVRTASRERDPAVTAEFDEAVDAGRGRPLWVSAGLGLAGLAALVVGATWLVDGATEIARAWGVPELVIGLTVVAIGTTAPEIATSTLAARRGEADLAVGNVVGSNLFNLLGVIGIAAVVTPAGIPVPDQAVRLDLPVMVGAALLCLPVFVRGWRVTRTEGVFLLCLYAAYLGALLLTG